MMFGFDIVARAMTQSRT